MNRSILAILPALSLALVGCEEKSATPAPAKTGTPAPSKGSTPAPGAPSAGGASLVDQAKEKAASATGEATDLKNQAVTAISTKYEELKKQITALKDKAPAVPAVAKSTYDSALSSLDGLTKEADAKLAELKAASGDAIHKAKDGLDSLMTKINDSIATAQKTLAPK